MRRYAFVFILGYVAVLQATALSPPRKSVLCTREGRFLDPHDCSSYIECISDSKGHMTSRKRSCYGKAFDPQTATCAEPSRVKGCHVRRSRHFVYSSSKFDVLCQDPSVDFDCGDCGTQITCIKGKAFETKCETNMLCNANISDFKGGVCHLKHNEKCSCNEPNTYRKDPYSDQGFFFCQGKDAIPKFYNCPSEMTFDENSKMCLNQYGAPACTRKGIFDYPNTCSRYYMCTFALEGWVQTELTCPPNQLFNEYNKVCENPCDWPLKKFSCKVQGRFGNPQNCRMFYECIADEEGSFIQMNRTCPSYYHWNDETGTCISEHDSKCRVKREGPIEHCRAEYEGICLNSPINDATPEENEGNTVDEGGTEEAQTGEEGEEDGQNDVNGLEEEKEVDTIVPQHSGSEENPGTIEISTSTDKEAPTTPKKPEESPASLPATEEATISHETPQTTPSSEDKKEEEEERDKPISSFPSIRPLPLPIFPSGISDASQGDMIPVAIQIETRPN